MALLDVPINISGLPDAPLPLSGAELVPADRTLGGQTVKITTTALAAYVAISGQPGIVTQVSTGVGLLGGPITTTGTISLADTAVTPGTYVNPTITVDQQGRLTFAAGGSGGTISSISTSTLTLAPSSPLTGDGSIDLTVVGVTPGSYVVPSITVDQYGRVTLASNGSAVTQVNTGTGLSGGPITTTGTISLANTAVTPGTYTLATVTVDQQGRITSAANGSAPGTGTVTNVATGTGLTGGPITTTGTIALANTAVTPGSYTLASITVDAQGRLTAASSGSAPGTGTVTSVATGTGLTGGPITTTGTVTLADTAVTPGTYTLMTGTVDQQGRLTSASGGSAVTSVTAGTGLSGGTITGIGTIDIASTGVSAGSYTLLSATVNAQGQLTAATSGSAVTSVTAGTGLSGGTITTTGTINLANTAVTPGSYTSANITVDAQGRLTAAANGTGAGSVTSLTASTGITLTPNPIVSTGTIGITNTAVTPGTYYNATLTVNAQGQLTAAASGTERVSVVDAYGVVPDGTTDITTAMTTALTSGKPLFVPPGNYKVGGVINYGSADVDVECAVGARFYCNKNINFQFAPTWGPIETCTAITEGTQCTNGSAFAVTVGGSGYVTGDILELPAERMTLKHYKLAPRWQVTTVSTGAVATITCIQPGVILGVFSSTVVNALTLRSVTGSGSGAQLGGNVTWSTAPSNGQNLVTQLSLVNVSGNLSADAVTITFDDASTISVGDTIKLFSADQKMAIYYTTSMTVPVATATIDGVRPRIVTGGAGYVVGNTITIARATTTPVAYAAQVQPIQAGFSPTDCVITVDAVTSAGAITQCHVTNAGSYRYVNYDVVGQGSTSGSGTGFTCYLTYDAGTNLVGFGEMSKVVRCVDKNTIWLQRVLRLPHIYDAANPPLVRKVPNTALIWTGGRFVGDPAVGSIHSLAVTGRTPAVFVNKGSTRIRMTGLIDEGVFERFIDDQSGYGPRYDFSMEDSVFLRAQGGFGYGLVVEASCLADVSVIAGGGTFSVEAGAEATSYSGVSANPQAIGPAMDCIFHDSVSRGAAYSIHPATMFFTWNNCVQTQATPDWQGTVQGDTLQRGFINQGYMTTYNNCRVTTANWAFEDRSHFMGYFGLMGAPNITSYKNCSSEWSDQGGTGAAIAGFRLSNVSSVANAWGLMDTRGMTVIEGCRSIKGGYFVDISEGSPRVLIRGGTAIDCDRFVNYQTMGRLTITDGVYDCSTTYHIPQVASSTIVKAASSNITGSVDLILDGMRCIYQSGGQAVAVIDQQDTSSLNPLNLWLGDIFIPLNFDQTLLHNGGGGLNVFDMKVDAFRGKVRVLAVNTGVNLNAIGDSTMVLPTNITRFLITGCYITNCTTNMTTARASVWAGAGATGDNFAADQAISGLTGTGTQLYQLTMTALAGTKTQSGPQVYFRVGTAQGSAAIGDVYIVGIDLSVG